jgi:hypothetical protein
LLCRALSIQTNKKNKGEPELILIHPCMGGSHLPRPPSLPPAAVARVSLCSSTRSWYASAAAATAAGGVGNDYFLRIGRVHCLLRPPREHQLQLTLGVALQVEF